MNRLGQNRAALIRCLGLVINFIANPPTTLGSKSFNSNLVRQSAELQRVSRVQDSLPFSTLACLSERN